MWLAVASTVAVAALTATRALAGEIPVDLELVLAVDVSASMTEDEQRLQRQGYVAAFQSPRVVDAIHSGAFGRIAGSYVEWGDPNAQSLVLPWTLVDGQTSAKEVARKLAEAPINRFFSTSIAGALRYSGTLFEDNGFVGESRVIDISGDGPNNVGAPVVPARDEVISHGITINGLPIMIHLTWDNGLYSIEGPDFYYQDCVIGGPGAFVVAIRKPEDFAATITRKLMTEISGPNKNRLEPISFC